MPNEVYVITGATGNIGRKIVEQLLAAKLKVRAIARKMDHLRTLPRGTENFVANLDDAGSVTHAFTGAKAVFTMIPPNYNEENFRSYQNRISEVFRASLVGAGVRHVVNLSSIGAHNKEKVGLVNGLFDHEHRLNQVNGVDILHLRPAYFMENHLGSLATIKKAGANLGGLKPDLPIPMIATADIAAEAVARLKALDFKGKTVKELLGPRDYTMNEITHVLGQVLSKPDLKYQQVAYEPLEQSLASMGFSKDVARSFVEMIRGLNDGVMKPTETRHAKNTTKTTFEEFAKVIPTLPKASK
jgi:uncharacterized protein YbjT (DUF2867 family)